MISSRSEQVVKSPGFLNDSSNDPPKSRADTVSPGLEGRPRYQLLLADGFEGVQLSRDDPQVSDGFIPFVGLDRLNLPADADEVVVRHAMRGDLRMMVHVGWGLETFRLDQAILTAPDQYGLAIFIETHRATIAQDVWRTMEGTKKLPTVRAKGDFSHSYCKQKLVFGDWDSKLAFMQPIFDRVGFLHGRIASPSSIQVSAGSRIGSRPSHAHGQVNYLDHFKELWTHAMRGFIRTAGPDDVLIFAPEPFSSRHYNSRKFPDDSGEFVEGSDCYCQALLYKNLARACFADAKDFA
jgi:hypothetical protein